MNKLLIGSSMMVLASIVSAQAKLTNVQWTKVGEGLKVEVQGENLTQPKIIRVMGGRSYMLEFDAHLAGKAKREKVNAGGVQYIQSGWFSAKPARVRVHLRLDNPESKLQVDQTTDGWQVNVNVDAETAVATSANSRSQIRMNTVPNGSEPLVKLAGLPLPEKVEAKALIGLEPDGFPDEPKKKPAKSVAAVKKDPVAPAAPKSTEVTYKVPDASSPNYSGSGRNVTLDMVNADIVQILKALAMQGRVNIVTSPEVKGTLTVSLSNVSVEEALNLITTLAGVKYAKTGSTYVVAASSERLKSFPRVADNAETRVVPIYSGEGSQIKAAVLKVVPMDAAGSFEISLPSDEITVEQTNVSAQNSGDKGGGGQGEAMKVETKSAKEKTKDAYVVIIGPKSRLDALERTVKGIDAQICQAMGIDMPSTTTLVRMAYTPRGTSAVNLLKTVAGASYNPASPNSAKVGSVDIVATPEQTIGEQTLTLRGRENEVRDLMSMMEALDTVAGGEGEYLLYEVKHLDPRSLREDLVAQFPGLQVTILPGAASNPALANDKSQYKQSAEYKADPNAAKAGSGAGADQGGQQGGQQAGKQELLDPDKGEVSGIALPFRKFEQFSFPMKIMLRGSKQKIDDAMRYLSMIDQAPKQVAIELRVMDIRKEDAQRIGLDWSLLTGGSVQNLRINQGVGDTSATSGTVTGAFGWAGGGALNVLASLDSIANDRNLIARPNLLGVDGRQSELFVGDIIRYIESIQSTQNGTTVTTRELPVGVRLAILPRVGGDGQITMELRPVVSTLTGFTPVPGGGSLPQTSLRVAQSTMNIRNGETIAIGGLIQDSDTISNGGIPILKDLPLIGRLFSRTDKSKRRSEIVFFLTARVVDDSNRTNAAQPVRQDPKKIGG